MKVPHKVTKLSPEQAYIYGFLEGKMLEEPELEEEEKPQEIERDEFATYESSNRGETLLIKDMNDNHLINAYMKMRKEDIHDNITGYKMLAEIKFRGHEQYLDSN